MHISVLHVQVPGPCLCTHIYAHVYAHMCTHMSIYVYTHVYTHAYTHVYPHSCSRSGLLQAGLPTDITDLSELISVVLDFESPKSATYGLVLRDQYVMITDMSHAQVIDI